MGLDVRCEMEARWDGDVRLILSPPLWIFDSYVSLIQNKLFVGTIRRISNPTNLAVTSWDFSCLLSPPVCMVELRLPPPPKKVERGIYKYVDCLR